MKWPRHIQYLIPFYTFLFSSSHSQAKPHLTACDGHSCIKAHSQCTNRRRQNASATFAEFCWIGVLFLQIEHTESEHTIKSEPEHWGTAVVVCVGFIRLKGKHIYTVWNFYCLLYSAQGHNHQTDSGKCLISGTALVFLSCSLWVRPYSWQHLNQNCYSVLVMERDYKFWMHIQQHVMVCH